MTYTLYIGNKRYSSWSMRPWIILKALDIPFEENVNNLVAGQRQPQFLAFSDTGKVPVLLDSSAGDTIRVWDTLAIIEYVAEKNPAVWPKDVSARAFARSAAAEMHSGFNAIRNECPMNVALRIDMGQSPSEDLQRDLDRLSALFKDGLARFGGPWLAGEEFTAVDAFFAPVASRTKTYGLQLGGSAAGYVERLFEHPAVQEWVQGGLRETARKPDYEENCVSGCKFLVQDLSIE